MNDIKMKKIGVVGLGPVGIIIAAHLSEAGCDVPVCEIDKIKQNVIRREGVRLEGVVNNKVYFKEIFNNVSELAEAGPDLIVFALKAHQMEKAASELASFTNKNIPVICALNGIDVEQIVAGKIGAKKTLRMVVNFAGKLIAKNIAKVTFFTPPNYIASIDGSCADIAAEFAALLSSVKLDTTATDEKDIQTKVWQKTILNASLSPLCAVSRLTMSDAMSNPDTRELIQKTMEEAVEIAEAEGHHYDDNFISYCMDYLSKAGNHLPSLAVDFINNNPTEIDYFNGKFVEYGKKHNKPYPINLSFTNTIKAVTNKHAVRFASAANHIRPNKEATTPANTNCFIGIDLGSAYTKLSVLNDHSNVAFQTILPARSSRQAAMLQTISALKSEFNIRYICATGYGRKHLPESDIVKTEINCAAQGSSLLHPVARNIIDIGGEDIKIIRCNENNMVESFYMNDKCAAGTGSFITEIADRAEINVSEMSKLASQSNYTAELNSFCTVFAKTEIMNWMFDGVSVVDIARGIYLSIANRVAKLRIDPGLPVFIIGGVIKHHPYLKEILEIKLNRKIQVAENPQYVVSVGAALIAKHVFETNFKNAVV